MLSFLTRAVRHLFAVWPCDKAKGLVGSAGQPWLGLKVKTGSPLR